MAALPSAVTGGSRWRSPPAAVGYQGSFGAPVDGRTRDPEGTRLRQGSGPAPELSACLGRTVQKHSSARAVGEVERARLEFLHSAPQIEDVCHRAEKSLCPLWRKAG